MNAYNSGSGNKPTNEKKAGAPTINEDGRKGGEQYTQKGKSSAGAQFIGPDTVASAPEVVDPNKGVGTIFDLSSHTED